MEDSSGSISHPWRAFFSVSIPASEVAAFLNDPEVPLIERLKEKLRIINRQSLAKSEMKTSFFLRVGHQRTPVSLDLGREEFATMFAKLPRQAHFEFVAIDSAELLLLEGLKFQLKIMSTEDEETPQDPEVDGQGDPQKLILYDTHVTVGGVLAVLLESMDQLHAIHSHDLILHSADETFVLDKDRVLHTYHIRSRDHVSLQKRRHTENLDVSTPISPRKHRSFSLIVLLPDLQIYLPFSLDGHMSVSKSKETILRYISRNAPNYHLNANEELDPSQFFMRIPAKREIDEPVWMDEDSTLEAYHLTHHTTIELKKLSTGSRVVIVNWENAHTCRMSITGILHSVPMTLLYSHEIITSHLSTLVFDVLSTENQSKGQSYYGLFVPSRNGANQGQWLNPDFPISAYQLKESGFVEFREDDQYTALMKAAAETFTLSLTPDSLVEGEIILKKKDHVTHLISKVGKSLGTVFLTNYRVIFIPHDKSSYDDAANAEETSIPLSLIDEVSEYGQIGIQIACKDWRDVIFGFPADSRNLFFKEIKEKMAIQSTEKVFAFSSRELFSMNAWDLFDPMSEYKRQGMTINSNWRVTEANNTYVLCPTYPRRFVVPSSVTDDDLVAISKFRSKGRMPAVVWMHPHNSATLTRCAQPRSGITRSRCPQDEKLVSAILQANPNGQEVYVVDSRPVANSIANTFMGRGIENTDTYKGTRFKFLGIGNIHVIRESFKKLNVLCRFNKDDNQRWLSSLENSHWLENLSGLLDGVSLIVDTMDKHGCSVITHCSDGWDRTAQLVSLSELMLDSYFRTVLGFEILLEKEWLSFGHRFEERVGHSQRHVNEESPIFVMFVDCVWQIWKQYPCSFQFNEHFLITILDHLYSCRFGTFLYSCEKERREAEIKIRTNSLWSFINSNITEYLNPFYIHNPKVLYPVSDVKRLQLWSGYYLRWDRRMKVTESPEGKMRTLEDKCDTLSRRIEELQLYK
eukprot:TRINITY_DN5632_c0_g1_i1.p1 TRINITY_DN5632_c0_g1~~TRINITY_DN5632_c0_g1_i1.p1  ORF type:complete len:988 (-),score=239.78 TRINITY_DN5632_c0_g1_i1:39-2960(-)